MDRSCVITLVKTVNSRDDYGIIRETKTERTIEETEKRIREKVEGVNV